MPNTREETKSEILSKINELFDSGEYLSLSKHHLSENFSNLASPHDVPELLKEMRKDGDLERIKLNNHIFVPESSNYEKDLETIIGPLGILRTKWEELLLTGYLFFTFLGGTFSYGQQWALDLDKGWIFTLGGLEMVGAYLSSILIFKFSSMAQGKINLLKDHKWFFGTLTFILGAGVLAILILPFYANVDIGMNAIIGLLVGSVTASAAVERLLGGKTKDEA